MLFLSFFSSLFFRKLWCAGILGPGPDGLPKDYSHNEFGSCPSAGPHIVIRFRGTCLYCRYRREWYGKWMPPPFWIDYTYKCHQITRFQRREDGVLLKITRFHTVWIDPRGHFTMLRCSTIIVLDELMLRVGFKKPLMEFVELLANYPSW